MAISRKPKPQQDTPPNQVSIDALIAKGGSPSKAALDEAAGKETASFTLRVPKEILTTLDSHMEKQPYKMPRQQWILEAVVQRLEREILAEYLPKPDHE